MDLCAKIRIIAILALLTLLLCSCGSSAKISEADSERITVLGNDMIAELNETILKYREQPGRLASLGYVVYNNEKTLGADSLAKFYVEYGDNIDTKVTMIFAGKGFVVARAVAEGGKCFYLRYEYNANKPEELAVSARLVSGVDLKYKDDPPAWELRLFMGKEPIKFVFKNPES